MKTYTYKLYNNTTYQKRFDRWIGICRLIYNLAKETKDNSYKLGVSLSSYDLQKQLPELKREFPFIKQVNSQSLKSVIERLDLSYKKFFAGGGFPKWAKKGKYRSISFKKQGVKETETGFYLPLFGTVKVFNKSVINGHVIKSARLIKEGDGLYLQIVCDEKIKRADNNQVCAIDMGIKYFLVSSDGDFIDNPRHLNKCLKQLRIENRSLSRKKKGSKSWWRQVDKLKRVYLKIRRVRRDFLHKQSSLLANNYGTIVRENLNVSGMAKCKNLSRHIYDCGWATFFTMLESKTRVIKVNPRDTSRTCPRCKSVHKENRPTQSIFECIECGHADNADANACVNILELGHQLMHANVNQ